MNRIRARILLFFALVLAIVKKVYARILALVPGKVKKTYARLPLAKGKKTCAKILIMLNISLLLLAIAILTLTLGTPTNSPVSVINKPTSGNTTEPASPNDTLPGQQESPGTGSGIIVEPSPSGSSSQQPTSIIKIGVYEGDPSGNQFKALNAIDWSVNGSIMAGQSRNSSRVYLRNEGNVPVTLQLSSQDWSSQDYWGNALDQSYQQYFSLTWDYDNSVLQVNQVRPVIFTLAVSPAITNVATFAFNIVVTVSS